MPATPTPKKPAAKKQPAAAAGRSRRKVATPAEEAELFAEQLARQAADRGYEVPENPDAPDDGLSRTVDTSAHALRTPLGVITTTDIPGVYRNRAGVSVDRKGRPLRFAELRAQDDARFRDVVGGAVRSPAELLKAVSLDPRMPLSLRMKAANQAAPYYDKRMPLRVDTTVATQSTLDAAKLAALTVTERKTLLELLKRLGVEL